MPKRPCAVVSTGDDSLIVGDKFGDVYLLPLHHMPAKNDETLLALKPEEEQEFFRPSASELTVHTKGNLEALRQQQKMKVVRSPKPVPTFDHKLILGHVSLLTDLVITKELKWPYQTFLLTADRDEHIRVSRGPPQAHVIGNYCLGHTEFISKLRILPYFPRLLISGGGDDCLIAWDWQAGRLLHRTRISDQVSFTDGVSMKEMLRKHRSKTRDALDTGCGHESHLLSVSGIWPMYDNVSYNSLEDQGMAGPIIVALEG